MKGGDLTVSVDFYFDVLEDFVREEPVVLLIIVCTFILIVVFLIMTSVRRKNK